MKLNNLHEYICNNIVVTNGVIEMLGLFKRKPRTFEGIVTEASYKTGCGEWCEWDKDTGEYSGYGTCACYVGAKGETHSNTTLLTVEGDSGEELEAALFDSFPVLYIDDKREDLTGKHVRAHLVRGTEPNIYQKWLFVPAQGQERYEQNKPFLTEISGIEVLDIDNWEFREHPPFCTTFRAPGACMGV